MSTYLTPGQVERDVASVVQFLQNVDDFIGVELPGTVWVEFVEEFAVLCLKVKFKDIVLQVTYLISPFFSFLFSSEVGIVDWDPRYPRPGTGTGTGNLKIRGRGQSLGYRDRAGDTKFKSWDQGQGRGLKTSGLAFFYFYRFIRGAIAFTVTLDRNFVKLCLCHDCNLSMKGNAN